MAGKIYGYLRITPDAQTAHGAAYRTQLTNAGAVQIFQDIPVPKFDPRPQFNAMLQVAHRGDAVVVVRLSHISTDAVIASRLVMELQKAGLDFFVLNPVNFTFDIDTRGAGHNADFALFQRVSDEPDHVDGGDGGGNGGGGGGE